MCVEGAHQMTARVHCRQAVDAIFFHQARCICRQRIMADGARVMVHQGGCGLCAQILAGFQQAAQVAVGENAQQVPVLIYTMEEVNLLKTLVDEEPRQIKTAQTKLADMTQKVASTSTLKRLLKKNSSTSGSGCVNH